MKYKTYFENDVPKLLSKLHTKTRRAFGLMTPQHMVEHLIWVTKSSVKDMGPAPELLSEKEMSFVKFIEKGGHFYHSPSDKTKDDLLALKYTTLAEAVAELPNAVDRMYTALANKKEGESFYNPMMGALTPEQMEFFHMRHYKWHLERQFGLYELV